METCFFCKKPVSDSNYQAIRQSKFSARTAGGIIQTDPGDGVVYIHSICDLPDGESPPVNHHSVREEPRTVHYLDVGSLAPPEVFDYLKQCMELLKKSGDASNFWIQPIRCGR